MPCGNSKVFTTAFNVNGTNPAVIGLMFAVSAKDKPLVIRTFEMDVKLGAASSTGLNVDVYVSDQPIAAVYNLESSWALIASTSLVPNPSSTYGGVIPSYQFNSIVLGANNAKSIFIRMKGRFIDNIVDKNILPGSPAYNGSDMTVYGGYFASPTDPTFPTNLSSSPAPIFAGRIYYDQAINCSSLPPVVTQVVFEMAIDQAQQASDNPLLQNAAYTTFQTLLAKDVKLNALVQNNGLQQQDNGIAVIWFTYQGCPSTWFRCNTIETTMNFQHDQKVNVGQVKDLLINHALDVAQAQLKVLKSGTNANYVGFLPGMVNFVLSLEGVNRTMDSVQTQYLCDKIVKVVGPANKALLNTVIITEQKLFDFGSIQVSGNFTGALIATDSMSEFAQRLDSILNSFKSDFVKTLRYDINFPGPIAENNRWEFFANVKDAPLIRVYAGDATRAPTPAPTNGAKDGLGQGLDTVKSGFKLSYLAYVGIGVAIFAFIIVLCCIWKQWSKKRKHQLEKKERLEERRQRALLNQTVEDDTVTLPKKIRYDDDDDEEEAPFRRTQKPYSDYSRNSNFSLADDKFNDEVSDEEEEPRRATKIYSIGGLSGTRRKEPPPKLTGFEPRGPHAEDPNAKPLFTKVEKPESSAPGEVGTRDLEAEVLAGDIFGNSNTSSDDRGAANNRTFANNSVKPADAPKADEVMNIAPVAMAGYSRSDPDSSEKDDDKDIEADAENGHSSRDLSSKSHRRSSSHRGESSNRDDDEDGEKSRRSKSQSGQSRRRSASHRDSDGHRSSSKMRSSKSHSRRSSASHRDDSDGDDDDDAEKHRSSKSRSSQSRRSSNSHRDESFHDESSNRDEDDDAEKKSSSRSKSKSGSIRDDSNNGGGDDEDKKDRKKSSSRSSDRHHRSSSSSKHHSSSKSSRRKSSSGKEEEHENSVSTSSDLQSSGNPLGMVVDKAHEEDVSAMPDVAMKTDAVDPAPDDQSRKKDPDDQSRKREDP